MKWPLILCAALSAFALVGAVCIALLCIYWHSVGRFVSELWPKLITKLVQLPAGAVTLGSAYAVGTDKGEWLAPAVAGLVCLAVWEVVGLLADNRVKATERIDKSALDRAEIQSELRTKLLTVFRLAVDVKARRTRRQIERQRQKVRITQVRAALTPEPHLGELLQGLAVFFQQQLPAGPGENRNFRVGVYAERDGVMTPVQAISLNDSSYTPFKSYDANQAAFRIDAEEKPSHVVLCVREKRMIVVEDCAEAAGKGEFHFFREAQRTYLQSIVAHYLGAVCHEDGTITEGALVVDTEAAGFFKESERDSLEFCLREFGARLRLELLLIALLTPRGTNP
jgi:hypothetical protein